MQIGLIIPQLFYDCIARIVPGTIMLLTVFAIWNRQLLVGIMAPPENSLFIMTLLYLMSVYIISFVIEGFVSLRFINTDRSMFQSMGLLRRHVIAFVRSLPLIKKYTDYFPENQVGYEDTGCEKPSEKETDVCGEPSVIKKNIKIGVWEKAICRMEKNHAIPDGVKQNKDIPICEYMAYDFIRLVNPEAGSRIVKLKAEKNLCENIGFGLLLIYTVYIGQILYYSFQSLDLPSAISRPCMVIPCLVMVIFFIDSRRYHLYILFLRSIYNHWLLIQCKTIELKQ